MSSLPEIIRLFTKLAAEPRPSNIAAGDDGGETARAVSSVIESLNSDHQMIPRVRVLEAALSLMCFKTPEVCTARIECLVQTIVSVLSSSVSCKVSRFGGRDGELLQVGSLISSVDCDKLIRACANVLESLEVHRGLTHRLLCAVLKAAISSSTYQSLFPLSSTFYEQNATKSDDMRNAISKLTSFLPEENSVSSYEIPLRLLLWCLDPLILKHDISIILREIIQRPFLCLKKELHNRMSWRLIVICLVTSPTMFIETRALLHDWFLVTGLPSVLELQIALVSSALDVLSRPMWWGVSMELGLKFPFSHAYFSSEHCELLSILNGPISCEKFLDLVRLIGVPVPPRAKLLDSSTSHPLNDTPRNEVIVNMVDNNSTWAILMDFPAWFYFATALIFCEKQTQDSFLSKLICEAIKTEAINDVDLHQAAAGYLSWILSPIDGAHCDLLADHMNEISRSWTMKNRANFTYEKQSYSGTHNKSALGRSKKLRIPKVNVGEKFHRAAEDDTDSGFRAWLEEFHGNFIKFYNRASITHSSDKAKTKRIATVLPNSLYLKIPLGILIGCPSYLDEKACELLLHYAATGERVESKDIQKKSKDCLDQYLNLRPGGDGRNWAIDGASLVLNLFDIIEDMSSYMFDCEDTQLDYICRMKDKAGRYLLRCVKVLLELQSQQSQIEEVGGRDAMLDLHRRLMQWRQQGREVFEGDTAFDDVVDEFTRRLALDPEQTNKS